MKFIDSFRVEDSILGFPGLYTMWTCLYIANFVSLLVDDTTGVVRDFNLFSNILSVIYCSIASVINIFGNQLPSTMLLISGPIHQYAFWILFAYFGGSDVLSSSAVGVMNWISLFIVGFFSLDMIAKTWFITLNPKKYLEYAKERE
tara:strand:- start:912 stop:1349 length:438 start_codon:yes stop_codon:yes gene_type:complete